MSHIQAALHSHLDGCIGLSRGKPSVDSPENQRPTSVPGNTSFHVDLQGTFISTLSRPPKTQQGYPMSTESEFLQRGRGKNITAAQRNALLTIAVEVTSKVPLHSHRSNSNPVFTQFDGAMLNYTERLLQ